MAAYPDIPKFKIPFAITGSAAQVVEQDSDEEIFQCVTAIMKTPEGTRLDEPEFGIPDYAFRSGIEKDELQAAIDEWEPRAEDTIDVDTLTTMAARAQINVQSLEDPNV